MAVIKGIKNKTKAKTKAKTNKEFKTLNPDDIVHITLTEHATVNLGDYESTKISFGITVPTTVSRVTETRQEVEDYVSSYIDKKVSEIKRSLI